MSQIGFIFPESLGVKLNMSIEPTTYTLYVVSNWDCKTYIHIHIHLDPPTGAKWMGNGAIKQPLGFFHTTHWRVLAYKYISYRIPLRFDAFFWEIKIMPWDPNPQKIALNTNPS